MRIDELDPVPTAAEHLEIPAELLGSVQRHQAHLADLIASLRTAGLNEDLIASSVRTLVDSYADELTIAIRGMIGDSHHG